MLAIGILTTLVLALGLFWYLNPCFNVNILPYRDLAPECIEYAKGVRDASAPESSEIENLKALSKTDDSLPWEDEPGESRLLVVNWTSDGEYVGLKKGNTLPEDHKAIWVTVVPDLKERCERLQPECRDSTLRLEQLLGLPARSKKTHFVELWVSHENLFRPCPDEETTDTACDLRMPENVSDDHRDWFNGQRRLSFGWFGYPWTHRYPWTQLGYTYDWGNPQSDVGLSEFVIRAGTKNTEVASEVKTTGEYLQ